MSDQTHTISRVSVAVEIDGRVYFVILPQEKLKILMKMAEGLTDDGKLPCYPAPDEYKFKDLYDEIKGEQHEPTE